MSMRANTTLDGDLAMSWTDWVVKVDSEWGEHGKERNMLNQAILLGCC